MIATGSLSAQKQRDRVACRCLLTQLQVDPVDLCLYHECLTTVTASFMLLLPCMECMQRRCRYCCCTPN